MRIGITAPPAYETLPVVLGELLGVSSNSFGEHDETHARRLSDSFFCVHAVACLYPMPLIHSPFRSYTQTSSNAYCASLRVVSMISSKLVI